MVKNLLPGQVGTNCRWTDEVVQALLVAADREVRERCGIHYHQQEIALTADTYTYDLDPEFVGVEYVEFSHDGTNYDHTPVPVSLAGLGCYAAAWRTLRGGRVESYSILSAPGVQAVGSTKPSQILVYPAPASTAGTKIRVTGTGVVGRNGVSGLAQIAQMTAASDVLTKCHLPRVMSVLYASAAPERAAGEYKAYQDGCVAVRSRFISQTGGATQRRYL
jgi:hypothetical protein